VTALEAGPRTRAPGERPRLAVIGGGITGLAAAHRVVERARDRVEIALFEASDRLGGVIDTERTGDRLVEGGPDSFIVDKPWALDLCLRLGLEARLLPTNERSRRTLVVHAGRLAELPEAFQLMAPGRIGPFLRTPLLSWRGKLEALKDLVLPRGGPQAGGDESLASFVRRRLGREVLERIAQPLVGGIYTGDPEVLSLAATMPRFLEMERSSRSVILALMRQGRAVPATGTSGARFGLFLALRGGIGELVDALAARLPEGSRQTRAPVTAVEPRGERGFVLRFASGAEESFDAVVVALPAPRAASVLAPLDAELASGLRAIEYASSAIVSVVYRRSDLAEPIDAFGVVVPHAERRRVIAASFSSIKFPGRAPDGELLVRAFVGGALQPELFRLDDEAMSHAVRDELRDLLRVRSEPLAMRIRRHPESMPQYRVGHLDRVAGLFARAARHPGLALAGNAYHGVGLPDCIRSGEAAADALLQQLGLVGDTTGSGSS
jgi:protoporphyrinogen/coproporphyrinogen III oxidase